MSTAHMAKKTKTAKRDKAQTRHERRFEPGATLSPIVSYAIGAIGALAMGAGAWEKLGPLISDPTVEPLKIAPYILTVGALLVGAAIWVGTSGEPPLRVGDRGIAVEKGPIRRMPWYAVERIEWRGEAVRVTGHDDAGAAMHVVAQAATHGQAAAWIVKEARERVPAIVDVPQDATLPEPSSSAGTVLPVEPPQVVGKHCAASGKVISFEPDARVCPRCELVYHKAHAPETCGCGALPTALKSDAADRLTRPSTFTSKT
jgi:hypothetical protein